MSESDIAEAEKVITGRIEALRQVVKILDALDENARAWVLECLANDNVATIEL